MSVKFQLFANIRKLSVSCSVIYKPIVDLIKVQIIEKKRFFKTKFHMNSKIIERKDREKNTAEFSRDQKYVKSR